MQRFKGITRLAPFLIWEEWNKIFHIDKKYEYQETNTLKIHSERLMEILENEKSARIIGHKGLGKTRLVLESFNPKNSNAIKILSDSMVYIDLATSSPTELSSFILNHGHLEGIIIVDNCSTEWHKSYHPIIKASEGLKMVTINDSNDEIQDNYIVIDRKAQRETVQMMFTNCFPGLNENEIRHFVNISEGFPEMVSFIDNAIKKNSTQLVLNTLPKDFVNKFLFADTLDATEYDLFKACSVFTQFGFYDDKIKDIITQQEQKKLTAQNQLIFTQIVKTPLNNHAFYKFCTKYRDKRTLLEKRGFYYSVIPEPIAVTLAAEWWEETSFDFVFNVLEDLKNSGLLIPMMDRLRMMDQSDRAKDIVSNAWGPGGPFSTAEVLNTELGSRLFRSVVEVNPIATVNALSYSFEDFTIEELRSKVLSGRRNIVWALEKLAFRSITFFSSTKMLMRLAAAENENYGNNATGQLMQLFHIQLPGTEAALSYRLKAIKWGLEQPENEIKVLSVYAAKHGLKSNGFHRTGGAENQGLSSRLKDYQPESWEEIYSYWEELLNLIVNAVHIEPKLVQPVKETIASSISSMFSYGQSKVVKNCIEHILTVDNSVWIDAIKNLKRIIDREKLNEVDGNAAEALLNSLQPADIENKLKLLVISPIWEYRRENLRGEETQAKAEIFAQEFVDDLTVLIPHLKILLENEQRQTFNFGASIAKGKDIQLLISEILKVLSEIPENTQNPALLAGIISKLQNKEQRQIIQEMFKNDMVVKQIFSLIRLIQPEKAEVFKLFDLVNEQKVNINSFQGFQYGRILDQFPREDVLELCEKIMSYGNEGAWTAFLLISQYTFEENEKWKISKDFVRSLMFQYNLLRDFDFAHHNDEYTWFMTLRKLLDGTSDSELATQVSKQIIDASGLENFPYFETSFREIAEILCLQYFTSFWPGLKEVLISDTISFYSMKGLLGAQNGANESTGILFKGDHELIFEWCKENYPKAAYRIAYMMPLFGNNAWTPLALKMINEFGDDEKFLNEIGANLGSFGMIGSSEDYYNRIIEMTEELTEHPKAKVRKWAKNCILYYHKAIRREKLEDENRS